MGLMAKNRKCRSIKKLAMEATKPWHKKPEVWIGIVANVIALGALAVAVVALVK